MIRENNVIDPKRKETKLKLKSPISPQLSAPMIVIVRAIQFNVFMVSLQVIKYNSMINVILRYKKKFIHIKSKIKIENEIDAVKRSI